MNEAQLRALIRQTVERRLGHPQARSEPALSAASFPSHASHALFVTVVNAGDQCVIEPAVTCNHCGYCKSQGF